jgi:hypothetical protein
MVVIDFSICYFIAATEAKPANNQKLVIKKFFDNSFFNVFYHQKKFFKLRLRFLKTPKFNI